MIGQFQVRKLPYGPLAHLFKRHIISFLSRNNQQSHKINILLTSFARSVGQVMDPRFFPSSRLGHKKEGKKLGP